MKRNRYLWAIGGGTLGVLAGIAIAVVVVRSADAPAEPPASLAETPAATQGLQVEAVPTLEPVAPPAIVEETARLAGDVSALNLSQRALTELLNQEAPLAHVEEAQRDVVARGLAVGVSADLLSDAVARQGGADASEMFAGIAKSAYVGAYAVALTPTDNLTASGIDKISLFLSAAGLGHANGHAVTVAAAEGALPEAVVSVATKRRTLRLEPLEDDFAAEAGRADQLLAASDPLGNASLDEMKSAVAARLALHAELDGNTYEVAFPTQILLSLAEQAPEAGRMVYETLASSEFGTQLYTFVQQETQRQVEQRITETLIDALFSPDEAPDQDALADAIVGAPSAAPPFEETFVEEILPLVPLFEVESIELTGGDVPAARITIAYEDVVKPTRVWCATRDLGGANAEPGAGSVLVVIDDAFDMGRWEHLPSFIDPVTFRCGSTFGVFAEGTLHPDETGTPVAPTEDRGIDTPPGATIGDPAGAIEGSSRLVVRVDWENPSDTELTLTCHFNGPAFTGQGGYNRETQTVGSGSGTATFVFDLGGAAEPGDYDFTCVLNDDVSRSGRTSVAAEPAEAWGVYDLVRIEEQRSSALGLIVAEASAVNEITLCSLDGGGLDCSITIGDMGGADLVLGPFATREEAVAAYCASLDPESVHGYWYPIATFSFDGQKHPIPNGPGC
ncbi:MAG: hypothetical protein WD939_06065 [Dehalococcoidia bacterium]